MQKTSKSDSSLQLGTGFSYVGWLMFRQFLEALLQVLWTGDIKLDMLLYRFHRSVNQYLSQQLSIPHLVANDWAQT